MSSKIADISHCMTYPSNSLYAIDHAVKLGFSRVYTQCLYNIPGKHLFFCQHEFSEVKELEKTDLTDWLLKYPQLIRPQMAFEVFSVKNLNELWIDVSPYETYIANIFECIKSETYHFTPVLLCQSPLPTIEIACCDPTGTREYTLVDGSKKQFNQFKKNQTVTLSSDGHAHLTLKIIP